MRLVKIKLCKDSKHEKYIETTCFFLIGESKIYNSNSKFRSYQYLSLIDPIGVYRKKPFSVKVKSYREVNQDYQSPSGSL